MIIHRAVSGRIGAAIIAALMVCAGIVLAACAPSASGSSACANPPRVWTGTTGTDNNMGLMGGKASDSIPEHAIHVVVGTTGDSLSFRGIRSGSRVTGSNSATVLVRYANDGIEHIFLTANARTPSSGIMTVDERYAGGCVAADKFTFSGFVTHQVVDPSVPSATQPTLISVVVVRR